MVDIFFTYLRILYADDVAFIDYGDSEGVKEYSESQRGQFNLNSF